MKFAASVTLFMVLIAAATSGVAAQGEPGAAQPPENLRVQLLDVQAKENDLQARLRQLEEDLKPENIERSLAGVGSTRPEELRDLRRRQLTIERDSLRNQLKIVGTTRERLETSIRTAEIRAYQENAAGNQILGLHFSGSTRWLAGMILSFVAILGIVAFMLVIRKRSI